MFWLSLKRTSKAVTLIEFLVVFSIVVIISSVVFANYQLGQSQLALSRASHKLSQDIRRASEMAMSVRSLADGSVPSGYGIYIGQGSDNYIIYADVNGNNAYGSGDRAIETVYLEPAIQIESVSLIRISVNFQPPMPIVKLSGVGGEVSEATIVLSLIKDSSRKKVVKINNAGLVYVDN